MSSRTYDDAIDALNSLQTNFKILEERRKAGIGYVDENIVEMMGRCLSRLGYSKDDLDRLNIVHVAGTKGKGTTCAYVDSILMQYRKTHTRPAKTGLFTSPHLIEVRERIRINSEPISPELFARYFFEVWDRLESTAREQGLDPLDKPTYFRYLTLMSFHVFLCEGVDAAVYEVGVGGEIDSTNVIPHPAATGISSLGIDHILVLGKTIESIAWHKAGIMKTGSAAYTVTQLPEAMKVLEDRAREKNVMLTPLGIDPRLKDVKIEPPADFQRLNASLAVALASTVLQKIDPSFTLPKDELPESFTEGLEHLIWRGRCETKVDGNITWCLDGAHTVDSLVISASWFDSKWNRTSPRVLIFNQQGRAEAVTLLETLYNALKVRGIAHFDHVVFCTNVTFAKTGFKRDFFTTANDPAVVAKLTMQNQFAEKWKELDPDSTVRVAASIEEAIAHVRNLADQNHDLHAFITGSLHLIGGALDVLERPRDEIASTET